MTLEEVIRSLRPGRLGEVLAGYLIENCRLDEYSFHRKSRDLARLVEELISARKYPLVDKPLGLVIAANMGSHQMLRAYLFAYHRDKQSGSFDMDADAYINEGLGYVISGARRGGEFVVGHHYRPDRFDKDLFMEWNIRR